MKIEVLGPGCPKCHNTEENVRKAVAELGKTAEVVKVTDIMEMIKRGVMRTPAVIVNGKIVIQGKIPTVEHVKELLAKEEQA